MRSIRSKRPLDADSRPPDYSHRFHAGNVGDVWKHCALVAALDRLERAGSVRFLDTHAGEGGYPLGPTGEWSEGIGRLWHASIEAGTERPVARYLDVCRGLVGSAELRRYPGSPAIARAVLGAGAQILLWERDALAFERLVAEVAGDARVVAQRGDGLAALAEAAVAAERQPGEVIALLDPTYLTKPEWLEVPDALAAAAQRTTRTRFLLWYPVKSLTRPNAMIARLEAAGMAGTVAELITTPLELQRNRLNGSGVLFVRPPAGALPAVAAAAATLGPPCATRGNAWSVRIRAFGEAAVER
jgi:23S rRNA (adenine2030-N6)-methyltransferase